MDEKRKGPVRRLFGTLWSFVGWLRVSLANLVFLLVRYRKSIAAEVANPTAKPGAKPAAESVPAAQP